MSKITMRSLTKTHRWLCAVIIVIATVDSIRAQTSGTHDSGTVQVDVFDHGFIGTDHTFSGTGFVFNGELFNLFTATVLVGIDGDADTVPYDGASEFTSLSPVTALVPPFGFPFEEFDQGFETAYSSPLGYTITQQSFTNSTSPDDTYLILDLSIENTSGGPLNNGYVGVFADWDVGPGSDNLGDYDAGTKTIYTWDDTGTSTNYFGVSALESDVSGWFAGPIFIPDGSDLFSAMTNGGGTTPVTPVDLINIIGTGPYDLAAGESVNVRLAFVGGTSEADLLLNAANALLAVIPVELLSFDAILNGNDVTLRWETASETNNAGFEVQMDAGSGFQPRGFVDGHGTTTEAQTYTYAIRDLDPGTYSFRLKQIDYDGAFEYYGDLEVSVETPDRYVLMQAYPNPFNPEATIRFAVRDAAPVTLTLHDALGRQVSTLYSGTPEANQTLSVHIDGSGLPSGLYLVRLTGSGFSTSQAVTLLK